MSSLKAKQIKTKLIGIFENILDTNDLPTSDRERETKILSRSLAAYAVLMQTGCSEAEAANAVWDGSDDNGIDAVYHDSSENRVIIVQAKWFTDGAGEPAAKDMASFANGIKDIVEQNEDNFSKRLQAKLSEVGQVILTPGVTIEIVVISTGKSQISKHSTANLDRILDELNGPDEQKPLASKSIIGLNELYDHLANNSSNDKISINATLTDWSFISHPYSAYTGAIDGLQLKEWWSRNGKRLVRKNIRYALGATEVNDGIRATASLNPEHFWYFNNGITLIADDAIRAPKAAASRSSGSFEFKGASIVNGAQTVSTLARIESDESLGKLRVGIRVIILKDAPEAFGRLCFGLT